MSGFPTENGWYEKLRIVRFLWGKTLNQSLLYPWFVNADWWMYFFSHLEFGGISFLRYKRYCSIPSGSQHLKSFILPGVWCPDLLKTIHFFCIKEPPFLGVYLKDHCECESSWGESCVLCVIHFPHNIAKLVCRIWLHHGVRWKGALRVQNFWMGRCQGFKVKSPNAPKSQGFLDAFARLMIPNLSWYFYIHPKSKYSHVGLPDITFIHPGDNGVIVFVKHLLWFHFYCWWLQIQVGRFMAIQVPRVYPVMMILAVEVILSHAIYITGIGINLYVHI